MPKQKPKLINTSIGALCIFRIENLKTKVNLKQLNAQMRSSNSIPLLMQCEKMGAIVSFVGIETKILQLNLQYIDSRLPELISQIAYYSHVHGVSKFKTLLEILEDKNPLKYNQSMGHPFYELKLKSFLTAIALGLTSQTIWARSYDAIGETIIVVNPEGYHSYDLRELHEYLLENARLEQVVIQNKERIKHYNCTWVYEEAGEYFIKLNLQVRFD